MHEHDLELIADYAAGISDEPEEAAALVSSCTTCSTEYETQQLVRSLVSSSTVNPLSDLERARLRREVWELAGFAPRAAQPRQRWWERRVYQFASAAAIVFVGIGLVGVLGQLQTQDTAADSIAAGDEAATAEAPVESVDRGLALEAAPAEDGESAEMAGDAMAKAPLFSATVDLGEIDANALTAAVEEALQFLDSDATATTEESGADVGDDAAEHGLLDDAGSECELPDSVTRLIAIVDGRQVVVAVGVDDPQTTAVAVYTDTCEPFDLG
jgi:hypothetical protein